MCARERAKKENSTLIELARYKYIGRMYENEREM